MLCATFLLFLVYDYDDKDSLISSLFVYSTYILYTVQTYIQYFLLAAAASLVSIVDTKWKFWKQKSWVRDTYIYICIFLVDIYKFLFFSYFFLILYVHKMKVTCCDSNDGIILQLFFALGLVYNTWNPFHSNPTQTPKLGEWMDRNHRKCPRKWKRYVLVFMVLCSVVALHHHHHHASML